MATLIDNYSGITHTQGIGTTFIDGNGQSFTGDGNYLSSASFYLQKIGSPTGTATVRLYTHSGTYGSTGIPDVQASAGIDIDVSTISTTAGWVDFPFGNLGRILTSGTRYVITFEYNNNSGSDYIRAYCGNTSGSSGNRSQQAHGTGIWTSDGGFDLAFKVYTDILPLVGALSDDFNDNSIDAAKWYSYGVVEESSGQLSITAESENSIGYISTLSDHSLIGGGVSVELISAGNQALATLICIPLDIASAVADSGDEASWTVFGGDIYAFKETAGGGGVYLADQVYNSVTHKYLRIRESSGTIYWDYSSDSQTWNNMASSTGLDFSGCNISMTLENEEVSSSSMIIDNVNVFKSTSSIGLYTAGGLTGSGEIGIYSLGNSLASGEMGLYTAGGLVGSGEINIYSEGKSTSSGEVGLYTYALLGSSAEIGLYTQGKRKMVDSTVFIDTTGKESDWIDTKGKSSSHTDIRGKSSDITDLKGKSSDLADHSTKSSAFSDT